MNTLPKGQHAIDHFPRMGLPKRLAIRAPVPDEPTLSVAGCEFTSADLATVPRRDQVSDFHCALTWSKLDVRWGGWALRDVYEQLIVPRVRRADDVRYLKFVAADGFYASLALEFALADGVLLADMLDGEPLPFEHGAPWRIVAPAHYGYKNVKHLRAIELCASYPSPFGGGGGILQHRDALVEREQRAQLLPGVVYRHLNAIGRPAGLRAAERLTRRVMR
jgi:DMSO/TMAO reductase YedYZ molybdopterin-dependent catalytic subunit